VRFIVNPIAGHGRAKKKWEKAEPFVAGLGEYSVRFTERPLHGEELARQAVADGCDRVVVFGGDGTINEVGNGLVGTKTAMAIIPTGSANDFVRTFPIPLDIEKAVLLAYEGRRVRIDAGLAEGGGVRRHFFNMVGAGFDAEIAGRVNDLGPLLKVVGGTLPTIICLIMTLFTYRYPTVTLKIDGESQVVPNLVLSGVGICRFLGGGMMLLPEAIPDDGLFDIMWAHDISRLGILGIVGKTYKGAHVGHPRIHFTRGKKVEVSSSLPLLWHMDGEVGGRLPMSFTLIPKAIDLMLPQA